MSYSTIEFHTHTDGTVQAFTYTNHNTEAGAQSVLRSLHGTALRANLCTNVEVIDDNTFTYTLMGAYPWIAPISVVACVLDNSMRL